MKNAVKKIASNILAMARGTLVVDECVKELSIPLKEKNIHIIEPKLGEKDEDIIERLLPNRIIITKNPIDFKSHASSYDIGIIDVSKLKFIDPSQIRNKTVSLISDAIIKFNLWSIRHGFMLTLHDNGKHILKELTQ
jgi:hypothetical protein